MNSIYITIYYNYYLLYIIFLFSFFIDEPKTGTTVSPSSPVPQSFAAKPGSMGLDTMNELADKEKFFHDIEGGTSSVNYNKKLGEISTSESGDIRNR